MIEDSVHYKLIENFKLFQQAKTLSSSGTYKCDALHDYCYLKIDDDYIHKLFPLLEEKNIVLPDYFSKENMTGAHISIVYPTEPQANVIKLDIHNKKIRGQAAFQVMGLMKATTATKTFFALTVKSQDLERLRNQYYLPPLLNYKELLVPFHITIGILKRDG